MGIGSCCDIGIPYRGVLGSVWEIQHAVRDSGLALAPWKGRCQVALPNSCLADHPPTHELLASHDGRHRNQ
jgi:hypothetical protein